jgi:hypothetical protein
MVSIATLREFRVGSYAVLDLAVSFLGMAILAPLLSFLLRKAKIDVPKKNWVILTLPIGILVHLLVGTKTQMVKDAFDWNGHYVIKIILLVSLVGGFRGIKRIKQPVKTAE